MIYDKELYKQHHKIKIMFGLLKVCLRIAMRYDRCAHIFSLLFASQSWQSFILD